LVAWRPSLSRGKKWLSDLLEDRLGHRVELVTRKTLSPLVDETLRRAFVRSLEIIGEAAKKVPEDFRAQHPTIEWRAMTGMRDRLIQPTTSVSTTNWCGMSSRIGCRPCAHRSP